MSNKLKYKVFCFEGKTLWREIKPYGKQFWEANDIGDAFNESVMENDQENLRSTTYQILPYDRGGILNISINIDSESGRTLN